ncbi:MAG: MBL fold metallo-hydrolase [Acetatifactor sp.]|nr:MBL fold metallo-hydrolase [Acetatifactor sp.]
MKIVNLIENTEGNEKCTPAHGLSFYIETKKHKLLVDSGPSELTVQNADALGIELREVDTVILSHGHYDHSGGLLSFCERNPRARIYMQKCAAGEYYAYDGKDSGYHYIGIAPEISNLSQVFFVNGDYRIDEELSLFIVDERKVEIPSTNLRLMELVDGQFVQDSFRHEQCLVIQEGAQNILFSGCAHNGILNIMECFKKKYGIVPDMVISGFHLMRKRDYTEEEIREVEALAEKLKLYDTRFFTCHCTGTAAYEIMKGIMREKLTYIHSGETVEQKT